MMPYLLSPIALFPLIGAVLTYIIGTRRPNTAGWIATGASTLSFLWVLKAFFCLTEGQYLEDLVFPWFASGGLKVDFLLRFDQLTAVMALVVTGIGSLIHLYSIGYMADDPSKPRFFSYLNLFMFSMLLLVLGGNLLVLFVGWEGVGLCSYLLIGFWHKNVEYASAGRKAFIVNRIGDAGFLLGAFLLFMQFGTIDFLEMKAAAGGIELGHGLIMVATFCLFVGATGKSAQIPLFVWLPDAMAGPTPVSALIHAATMVTAGVYLLARLSFLYVLAPTTLAVITFIAVLTAFVAATTALVQNDIKKVLAYSTVSQLGFMFMAASAGAFWVAIFHVVTHAFFKACLFLGAGSVIHGCHHEQDMRKMGGLREAMPITFWTYLLSTIAIAGIAPFAGYYSKHAITEALKLGSNPLLQTSGSLIGLLVSVTAFLTAFYMTRSLILTFFGGYRGEAHPHESPMTMCLPLIVLAGLSTVGGILLVNALPEYLSSAIAVNGADHHETFIASVLHSWVGFLGVGLAVVLYTKYQDLPGKLYERAGAISRTLQGKYFFDELYAKMIVNPLEGASRFLWNRVDVDVIDFSVNGTAWVVEVSGEVTRLPQTGQVRHYALYMFGGTLLLILLCFMV